MVIMEPCQGSDTDSISVSRSKFFVQYLFLIFFAIFYGGGFPSYQIHYEVYGLSVVRSLSLKGFPLFLSSFAFGVHT